MRFSRSISLFAFILTTIYLSSDVDGRLVTSNENAGATAQESTVEYFTIHQVTKITRRKRDAVNHVDFPLLMHFNFRFKSRQMSVRLKRNDYMTSDIKLSDANGPIQHDLGRKTGIYSDPETLASFIVQCEDHMEHCVLRGSMLKDGRLWDILPHLPTSSVHRATQSNTNFTIDAESAGVPVSRIDNTQASSGRPRLSGTPHSRRKRAIPTDCELVECFAIADETVWEFHLAYASNDVATAEANLAAEYLALYTQADLHFDFVSFRRPGSCIRLYLVGVLIEKTRAESWSAPNEISLPLPGAVFINGIQGIITCGAQGDAQRTVAQTIDLIQCYTKKDIAYNSDPAGDLFTFHRSTGFIETACNPAFDIYSASIIEQYGDKVERLLAHEVSHGLGANEDSAVGCVESDQYIMAETLAIPDDDFKLLNVWYFSTCTLGDVYTHIDSQAFKCLRDNSFTEAEYDNFANQPLAGTIYDWDTQCIYRFGLTSVKCDPTGASRTFFPDMCDRGIFCTNPQAGDLCTGQTRPYDGTLCGDLDAYCLKGVCTTPPLAPGDPCTIPSDCAGPFTTCSITTNTCVCLDGYYENSTATCEAKVDVGVACPEVDACLDTNAFCDNGVCACNSGYYDDGGSCSLLKYAGENCTSAVECYGTNIECSGSPSTCRCPSDRYLDFDGGECLSKKILEESCESGQCATNFSFCDSTTSTCQCQDGYYDDNGTTSGGSCVEKVALNAYCPQPDACSDPNAECNSTSCVCLPDFVEINSVCENLRCVGENCTAVDQCRGEDVECSGSPSTCRCPSDRYHDVTTGNCLPNKILEESCETGQCGTNYSYCDSTTNTCECQEGFFDDNGARSGGNCLEKLDLNGTCTQPDACADPNAECSWMVCICQSEYFDNNGTCEPLRCVGETCSADNQCRGDNVECSGWPSTCRCDSDRYHNVSTGDCMPKKTLEERCEPGQCGPDFSFCDLTTNTCECQYGFYDDNGFMPEGNCTEKLPLNDTCLLMDACADPNAECTSMTCCCRVGFYDDVGTCEQLKCCGDNCTRDDQCRGEYVECDNSTSTCRCPRGRFYNINSLDCELQKDLGEHCRPGQCKGPDSLCDPATDTCECQDGFFDDNGPRQGGTCLEKLPLNDTCEQKDACADPNAECVSMTCCCQRGYYDDVGTCERKRHIGEKCKRDDQCRGKFTQCRGRMSTCRCPLNRFYYVPTGKCEKKRYLGQRCVPGSCRPRNSVCGPFSRRCECYEGFFDGNGRRPGGKCLPKRGLNETCYTNDACKDPNAICRNFKCDCKKGFDKDGTCRPFKCFGEECDSDDQCGGKYMECSGYPSTCRCPLDYYLDMNSGNCVPSKRLGDHCEPGQCGTDNSFCNPISNKCDCYDGFFDDNGPMPGGNCTEQLSLNETCVQIDACADPNAECVTMTCCCRIEFYEHDEVCEPLKGYGENCTRDSQCRGNSIECSGSPSTCRCMSDLFYDVTTGECGLYKQLGDSCQPGQCGHETSYCDSTTNTCECLDGSYDSNGAAVGGNCTEKLALNETCLQMDACADPNAECSLMVCSCSEDYFENNGVCEPLKGYGENCTRDSQCRGNSIECSGSPSTCRCMSDLFYDVTTGECGLYKQLGDSCQPGQCGHETSYCDSTTNTCECLDGSYDSNGAAVGGNCTEKVDLNAACSQPDACTDVNAVCLTNCVCDTDFYDNAGTCEPLLCVGESCSATSDCKGSYVECSGSPSTCRCPSDRYHDVTTGDCLTKLNLEASCVPGQCGTTNSVCDPSTDTCLCADGYFDDNGALSGGSCLAKVALNAACSQPDACTDANAVCLTNCVCDTDFYDNAGTCEPLLCVGESCSATSDCKGSNVECSGSPSTCRCPSDRYHDVTTGNCLTKLVLGDSCEAGQCGTTNAVCDPVTSTCLCIDGYFDDNEATSGGSCSAQVDLGVACSLSDACSDVNAVCSTNCVCDTDYYDNAGTCEPLLCVGENCSATSDCKGSNVECSGSPSTCRCPSDRYHDVTTGNCLAKLVLGESCEAGQCGTTNAVCDPVTSTCLCIDGYFDDNGATSGGTCSAQVALDVACSQSDACLDVNAVCSTNCVCDTNYYNNAGTCEPLLCIGETCVATSDCKGSNVECSGTPSTCRCPSDRYLDETTGNCLAKIALGQSCLPGQCLGDNVICQPATDTCECPDGFLSDGTNCLNCPSADWQAFQSSCYFFGTIEVRYQPARDRCDTFDTMTDDSNLVQVDTMEELTFLKDFMTNRATQPNSGYWNDLYQATTNGNEVWRTSGDVPLVTDWNPNQPVDNGGNLQECTIFVKAFSYRQGDFGCTGGQLSFPLCEITPA